MAYYTDFRTRGFLSSKLQLRTLREGLAAGVPHPTMVLPLFAGGARHDPSRVLLDIDTEPWAEAGRSAEERRARAVREQRAVAAYGGGKGGTGKPRRTRALA